MPFPSGEVNIGILCNTTRTGPVPAFFFGGVDSNLLSNLSGEFWQLDWAGEFSLGSKGEAEDKFFLTTPFRLSEKVGNALFIC